MAAKATAKKTTKKPWTEPRLPPARINELALGIFQGAIFHSAMLHELDAHLLPCVFMPLASLSEEQKRELAAHPPALLYGPLKTAFPRSVNGYPFLSEMGMVYAEDAKLLRQKVEALSAATKTVLEI